MQEQKPAQKKNNWKLWLSVVAVVLVCSCCGFALGTNSGKSSTSTQATVATTPTQAPTKVPTVAPTPTSNPNASAPVYAAMVQTQMNTLSTDMSTVGTDCGNEDITACHDDLQALRDDIHTTQTDLDATPAPPCFKTADADIRAALNDLDTGAMTAINGIDQNDASLLNQGAAYITKASTELTQATAATKAAHC
jgi:hypothetical protein